MWILYLILLIKKPFVIYKNLFDWLMSLLSKVVIYLVIIIIINSFVCTFQNTNYYRQGYCYYSTELVKKMGYFVILLVIISIAQFFFGFLGSYVISPIFSLFTGVFSMIISDMSNIKSIFSNIVKDKTKE